MESVAPSKCQSTCYEAAGMSRTMWDAPEKPEFSGIVEECMFVRT